jgi:GAF domain-containing protein
MSGAFAWLGSLVGERMAARTTIDKGWNSADPVGALSAVAMLAFRDAHEAAQAIFGLIHELFGLRICVLSRVDLAANTLTVLDAFDKAGLGIAKGMVVPANEMPCDFVVRSASALRHTDLGDHPVFSRMPICAQLGVRTYVGVPLRRSDGTVWGTLAASDTEVHETTDAHLQILVVLARLVAFEFEREEQREALAAHARDLANRLAMVEALEEERLRAVRLQTVLEAAATVSHEVNNPLTVLQLRLARLSARRSPADSETQDDLEIALDAAKEIHQVTVRLRQVVRPVSTQYVLSGKGRMLDLAASTRGSDCGERVGSQSANGNGVARGL